MRQHFSILSAICGLTTLFIMGSAQVALSSFDDNIDKIAASVTVRIDGDGRGSGVIVNKKGNVYTVVTNCHVITKARGSNFIISPSNPKANQDDHEYSVFANQNNCQGNADLAELQFTSNQTYPVAKIENPLQLRRYMPIYVSGWVGTSPYSTDENGRGYRSPKGEITEINETANRGYHIVHNANSSPGMSGGPVFNDKGKLIGINGQARPQPRTENMEVFAIPINIWAGEPDPPSMGCDDYSQELINEGDDQRLQSNYRAAFDYYRKATEHSSWCYEAWYNKARTLLSLGEDEEAISAFNRALAIQPDKYGTWCKMGNVLVLLDRLQEAEASYKEAIAIKPDAPKSNNSCKILSNRLGGNSK